MIVPGKGMLTDSLDLWSKTGKWSPSLCCGSCLSRMSCVQWCSTFKSQLQYGLASSYHRHYYTLACTSIISHLDCCKTLLPGLPMVYFLHSSWAIWCNPSPSMSLLCSNASLSPHITQRKGNSYKLSMYNPSLTSSPNQRQTHRKGSLSRIELVVKAFPSTCPSWGQPLAFLASFVLWSHHVLEQWYHFHEPCSPLLTLLQSHWCPCCCSNSPGQLALAVLTAWHALPSNGCMAPSPFRILPKYSFWGRSSLTILFTITTPSAHPPSTLELFFSTTFIIT